MDEYILTNVLCPIYTVTGEIDESTTNLTVDYMSNIKKKHPTLSGFSFTNVRICCVLFCITVN